MNIIHMETESVEVMIEQLRRTFLNLEESLYDLQQMHRRLNDAWYGSSASNEYQRDFSNLLQRFSTRSHELETLELRLKAEYQEWLTAAATLGTGAVGAVNQKNQSATGAAPTLTLDQIRETVCGSMSGSDKDRCIDIWSKPPATYEQLAYMIMNLPPSYPIVIMQTGEGEYLVLLRGTTSGIDQGSNWGSAVESMFGDSSYQNSVIEALQNANLPEGAKLNFAGHSQGGMVAQNLAIDPRVSDVYKVESVTMFGSPDTLVSSNKNARYISFEAPGDVVPSLNEIFFPSAPSTNDSLFHDNYERNIIVNNWEAWNPNPEVSHSVYDNPGVLTGYETPYKDAEWTPVQISGSKVTTLGPNLYKLIIKGKEEMEAGASAIGQIIGQELAKLNSISL